MSKHVTSVVILLMGIGLGGGCCVDRVYRPNDCDEGFDAVLGSCHQCGTCSGGCEGHTPCQSLKHVLTCGAGCGQIYWGEWLSDPPDQCDPCDNCGSWIGPRCCPPTFWERLTAGLQGWRCASDGCCDEESEYIAEGRAGEIILDDTVIPKPEPSPADQSPHTKGTMPTKPDRVSPQERDAPQEGVSPPMPMSDRQTIRLSPTRRAPSKPLLLSTHAHKHTHPTRIPVAKHN